MSDLLNHTITGNGETVLILHGLFGSSANWKGIARALAAEYQVITVDLRNHGGSLHADSMTYRDMANDIRELVRGLSVSNPVIIGHSMGGKAAMLYALEYPEFLEKLLILDIAPVVYNNEYHDIIDSLSSIDVSNLQTRSDADTLLQEKIEERILRHFLLQNLTRTEDGFKWRINIASIRSHLDDIIGFPELGEEAKFDKPALFIAGENSKYIKSEHHPEIFRLYPGAEIISIPGAGHWVHVDQPQLVLQNIKDFLGA